MWDRQTAYVAVLSSLDLIPSTSEIDAEGIQTAA
jgi:hypothetical protein